MRVAIVNDLKTAITVLKKVLEKSPGVELAWIAENGKEAVEKCAEDTPDLVLMDLLMPVMNGVESTKLIMQHSPCAILIVTFSVGANASMVFEAMGHGALDAVKTPVMSPDQSVEGIEALQHKMFIIKRLIEPTEAAKIPKLAIPPVERKVYEEVPGLILLGASTGGPSALAAILRGMPEDLAHAIIIVQHLDEHFAQGFANWLHSHSGLHVQVAESGHRPKKGEVLVAGKEDHLTIDGDGTLRYVKEPFNAAYRPSIDVFFASVAAHWPSAGVAALLTGMGRDGAEGLKSLHEAGWTTLAEDESSCVVYGMPKAALALNAVGKMVPIHDMAREILQNVELRR